MNLYCTLYMAKWESCQLNHFLIKLATCSSCRSVLSFFIILSLGYDSCCILIIEIVILICKAFYNIDRIKFKIQIGVQNNLLCEFIINENKISLRAPRYMRRCYSFQWKGLKNHFMTILFLPLFLLAQVIVDMTVCLWSGSFHLYDLSEILLIF